MIASIRSLDPPHKGLRNALSQFVLLAGKTEYDDPIQVGTLQKLGNEVFHLLQDHTHTEDNFILKPLEEKIPGSTIIDSQEHIVLEQIESELKNRMSQFDGNQTNADGHQFYLDLILFQSRYLDHIGHEDKVTEILMMQNFSDEELIGHQILIMQQMSFETLLLWFKYIVPARRISENRQVLQAFKSSAPNEAFDPVKNIIRSVVSEQEFDLIFTGL
jgi:hypothetical protein